MSGEYTDAIVSDLRGMADKAIALWGLSPRTDVTLLNLSENATFRLSDPASGRRLALRIHRIGYSTPEEIRSELAWIEALIREGVVETARPARADDGAFVQTLLSPSGLPPRHAVAFAWVTGHQPDLSGELGPWFERLGALTARLHRQARGWARPAGFRRKRWDLGAMVGPDAHWGSWRAAAGLPADGIGTIDRALADITERVTAFGADAARFGLVHADLRLANLLVDGDHLRVIDFDDCGESWFLYDLAASLSFIEHEPMVPTLVRAWIRGYRCVGELSGEDEAMIPTFIMLRRIMLTAWLASHGEIPFAREIGADYAAGTVRLARDYVAGRLPRHDGAP
jgi:Ser/Thr protein kinase RdoA (MazF antagonist)